MSKVIDLSLSFPDSEEEIVSQMKLWALGRGVKGLANYRYIFGERKAQALGLTFEELERMAEELSPEEFEDMLRERARKLMVPTSQFVKELDEIGVEWGVTYAGSIERTAEVVAQYPNKFIGEVFVNPHEGMKAVKELERAVKELGLGCLYASPYRYGIQANDKKYYPLYAKAVELGIPVVFYTSMNYSTALPMDIGRPLYLDEVAMDFPEMTIIAAMGGWPWVPEMIGVARRHQNVYIDTSSIRPKYFATPGSGWEMLIQFGNTLLQDRILFASGWGTHSLWSKDMLKNIIQEIRSLPLKEEVKEKWLYKNAARLFNRD